MKHHQHLNFIPPSQPRKARDLDQLDKRLTFFAMGQMLFLFVVGNVAIGIHSSGPQSAIRPRCTLRVYKERNTWVSFVLCTKKKIAPRHVIVTYFLVR